MTAWQCRRLQPLLVDCAEGALGADEEARVRAHARQCEECGAVLAALQEVPAMLRALPVPRRDEDFWRRQRDSILRRVSTVEPGAPPALARRFTWAAGLAAAAVVALVLASQRRIEPTPVVERVAVEGLGASDVLELAELSDAWNGEADALSQSGLAEEFVAAGDFPWIEPDSVADDTLAVDLDDDDLDRLEELIG